MNVDSYDVLSSIYIVSIREAGLQNTASSENTQHQWKDLVEDFYNESCFHLFHNMETKQINKVKL